MKKIAIVITFFAVLGMVSCAWCAENVRTATVSEANGSVEVMIGDAAWSPASVGMILKQGDSIRTKGSAWAILSIDGAEETATVEVKQNSEMKLATLIKDAAAESQSTLLDLSLGEILIKAKKLDSEKSRFEVKTPTSIVGVRGTTFSVSVEALE